MDLHTKAQELLEMLANSFHDRAESPIDFCFTIRELHIVEKFLGKLEEDARTGARAYKTRINT